MKLQREDIHPLQDTCPYFSTAEGGVYRHRLGEKEVEKIC